MRDTQWLIRKTLLSTFKNYKNILLYFGLPIVGILLAALTQGGNTGDAGLTVGIVNRDVGQTVTTDAVAFVAGLEAMKVEELPEAEVNERVESGALDAALVFPAGFAQSLRDGKPEPITLISAAGAQISGYANAYLNPYIETIAAMGRLAEGDGESFDRLYADYRSSEFRLSAERVEDSSINHAKAGRTIGYLIILMLFSASTLAGILMKERENRTYFRVLSSPVSSRAYVASNIAVSLFVMLAQISVTLLIMIYAFRIEPGISYGAMFLMLALFALVAVSLSFALVAFARNSLSFNLSQTAVFMPTCLLAGCLFPLDLMPVTMQKIAYFLPQYWLMDMFGRLQLGDSFGSLYANALILLAFAAALALIAVYKFGRNNDTRSFV